MRSTVLRPLTIWLFAGGLVCLGPARAQTAPVPLVIAVDCTAGTDLRTALEAAEAAAAPRIDCAAAPTVPSQGDGDDDDDDDDARGGAVTCTQVARRALTLDISGVCELGGEEPLTFDTDWVSLRGVTPDAAVVAGSGMHGFIVTDSDPVQFVNLRIDCSATAEWGTCINVGYSRFNLFDATLVTSENSTAILGTASGVFLNRADLSGGRNGLVACGESVTVFSSTLQAEDLPLAICDTQQAVVSRTTITSPGDAGMLVLRTHLTLSLSRVATTLVVDRAAAAITTTELDGLSVRRGSADVSGGSAGTLWLDRFSTSVIGAAIDTEVSNVVCDVTSNAQCLSGAVIGSSSCDACPGRTPALALPRPETSDFEALLGRLLPPGSRLDPDVNNGTEPEVPETQGGPTRGLLTPAGPAGD